MRVLTNVEQKKFSSFASGQNLSLLQNSVTFRYVNYLQKIYNTVLKQDKNVSGHTWLKTAPNFSSDKILKVFVEMATTPSGHCSEENPEAYSKLS